MLKLNLGCGDVQLEGFVNADVNLVFPQHYYEVSLPTELVINMDIREELPYLEDSVDAITISHVLSGISKVHYPSMFRDFYRILKDGGVIRIADDNHDQTPERFHEWNFDNPVFKGSTSPTITRKYLEEAGFEVYDVGFKETHFKDTSLIQVNHNRDNKDMFFHIEGVKNGKSKEQN